MVSGEILVQISKLKYSFSWILFFLYKFSNLSSAVVEGTKWKEIYHNNIVVHDINFYGSNLEILQLIEKKIYSASGSVAEENEMIFSNG